VDARINALLDISERTTAAIADVDARLTALWRPSGGSGTPRSGTSISCEPRSSHARWTARGSRSSRTAPTSTTR
jgi:hypothetical protein